ncbi:MAG: hypothetical protein RI922_57 [Bacteroidota bacterium]|jgi:hypothetical protein
MVWQIIGFVSYFEFSHFKLKKEIKSLLKESVSKDELVYFRFSASELEQLTWLNKHEFEFEGRYFDVVKQEKLDNGLYSFECLSDIHEKELFKQLEVSISCNLGNDKQPTSVSNWFKLIKLPFLSNNSIVAITLENKSKEKVHLSKYLKFFQSIYSEIDSPPPQFS